MGFGCSYHPYECSHDNHCIHCTNGVRDWHDPNQCALCDPFQKGKPERLVKEEYAHPIRVVDLSYRQRRIKVNHQIQGVLL